MNSRPRWWDGCTREVVGLVKSKTDYNEEGKPRAMFLLSDGHQTPAHQGHKTARYAVCMVCVKTKEG